MDPTGAAALAQAIAPPAALERAACRTHAGLFTYREPDDPARMHAYDAAQDICASCPVRRACQAWLMGLRREQWPCGVVAGRIIEPLSREQAANRVYYRRARAKRRLAALQRHEHHRPGTNTLATVAATAEGRT